MKIPGVLGDRPAPSEAQSRPAASSPAVRKPPGSAAQSDPVRFTPTDPTRSATAPTEGGIARPVLARPSQATATPVTAGSHSATALVEHVRGAIEERLGMLPAARAATGDADSPREALAALGRLFRAAAADPVLGVRASPAALQRALELGSARAAAALANEGVLTAADRDLLTDLTILAGRLLAAARPAEPTGVAGEAGWVLRMLSRELRLALEEARLQVPGLTDGDAPVGVERTALELARILAEAMRTLPPADPRASRAAAEAVLDTALRRTLLQLPKDQVAPTTLLQGLRGDVGRFLAAAEAAAPGLAAPVPWTRVAFEAATAMLRDREPPFRLDLFPGRWSKPARRRREPGGNPDRVEPIETSDPDDDAPVPPGDRERSG